MVTEHLCVLLERPAGSGPRGWRWEPQAGGGRPRRVRSVTGKRGGWAQSAVLWEEGWEGREGVHAVDRSAAGAGLGPVVLLFQSVYWDVISGRIRLPFAHDGVTVTLNIQKNPSCPPQSIPSHPPDPSSTPAAPADPTGCPPSPARACHPSPPHADPSGPCSPHLASVTGTQGCLFWNVRMGPSVCVSLPTPQRI